MSMTILEHAVDSFSFLTIASVCMRIFRGKFLTETWAVLLTENSKKGCTHGKDCTCEWTEARKVDNSSPLEIQWKGEWEPRTNFNIMKEKFVKSAIGLIPVHGYSCKDNHSKESIEWLSLIQSEWTNKGKILKLNMQEVLQVKK